MPIYEYQAKYCLKSLFCERRFTFWQNMCDAPVSACHECGAPLEKILSVFSAGADVIAHSRAASDPPPGIDGSSSHAQKHLRWWVRHTGLWT